MDDEFIAFPPGLHAHNTQTFDGLPEGSAVLIDGPLPALCIGEHQGGISLFDLECHRWHEARRHGDSGATRARLAAARARRPPKLVFRPVALVRVEHPGTGEVGVFRYHTDLGSGATGAQR